MSSSEASSGSPSSSLSASCLGVLAISTKSTDGSSHSKTEDTEPCVVRPRQIEPLWRRLARRDFGSSTPNTPLEDHCNPLDGGSNPGSPMPFGSADAEAAVPSSA